MKKIIFWILISSILFFTISLFLFSLKQPILIFGKINSELFSNFGSYIGGTLGIILTSVTVYLLYETYGTQQKQLILQKEESILRSIDLQYDQITKDIEGIKFDGKSGVDALHGWNDSHKTTNSPNNVFNTLNFVLNTFSDHIEAIERNNITDEIKEHLYV